MKIVGLRVIRDAGQIPDRCDLFSFMVLLLLLLSQRRAFY